jgi:WXG100 family type VII secretion target
MSGPLDALAAQVRALIGALEGAIEHIVSLNGPHQLTGDPAALGSSAAGWRPQAASVRAQQWELDAHAQAVIDDAWQGSASSAFAGQWQGVSTKVGDLAARYDGVAGSLEDAAARARALDAEAVDLTNGMNALVAARSVRGPTCSGARTTSWRGWTRRGRPSAAGSPRVWGSSIRWARSPGSSRSRCW